MVDSGRQTTIESGENTSNFGPNRQNVPEHNSNLKQIEMNNATQRITEEQICQNMSVVKEDSHQNSNGLNQKSLFESKNSSVAYDAEALKIIQASTIDDNSPRPPNSNPQKGYLFQKNNYPKTETGTSYQN